MYATLLTAVILAQSPQPATGTQSQPGRDAGQGSMTHSLDGNWTVVALERQGQPVADVSGMTVTVRNGTVTFDGGPATSRMQPMRIEYGALGTIRVSDAAGSGSGSGSGTTGSGTGSGTGTGAGSRTGTGAGTASGQPGTTGSGAGSLDRSHARTGVVVHTRDYAAVMIFDAAGTNGTGTGTGIGSGRSGAGSGTTPGSGTGTSSGSGTGSGAGTGTGTGAGSGQGSGTGSGSGATAGHGSTGPTPSLVVFLRKSGAGSDRR